MRERERGRRGGREEGEGGRREGGGRQGGVRQIKWDALQPPDHSCTLELPNYISKNRCHAHCTHAIKLTVPQGDSNASHD